MFGKRSRVARQIECLGCKHTGRLVISVILSGGEVGQEGEDDGRPRQSHDAHQLVKAGAVSPVLERVKDILADRIAASEEPHVRNSEIAHRLASFDFANVAHGHGLLGANFVDAAFAVGSEYHGNALVLVIYFARQVGFDQGFIIGMRDHKQDVGLEARIGGTVVGQVAIRLKVAGLLCGRRVAAEHGENSRADDDCPYEAAFHCHSPWPRSSSIR